MGQIPRLRLLPKNDLVSNSEGKRVQGRHTVAHRWNVCAKQVMSQETAPFDGVRLRFYREARDTFVAYSHTCANCFSQRERVSVKRASLTEEPSVTASICTSQRFVLIKHSLSSMKPSRCERSHTSHRLIIVGKENIFETAYLLSKHEAMLASPIDDALFSNEKGCE